MLDTTILLATLGATGILGVASAYLALKAFRRVRDESLLLTATGFGLVSSGTIFGAVACVFLNIYDVTVHIVETTLVAVGLFSIILSVSRVKAGLLEVRFLVPAVRADRRRPPLSKRPTVTG